MTTFYHSVHNNVCINNEEKYIIFFRLNEYFEAHPNLHRSAKGLMHMFNMMEMASESADSWCDVSRNMEYRTCPGDLLNNWKERGYSTILDILMVIT